MRWELPGDAEDRAERRGKIPEWTAAASAGDVEAQLALAWEYARGDAVEADLVAAWHWFDRAASSGREDGRLHRARFLQLRGVPEGVRELRKLAAKGNWEAQFWLAWHHQSQTGRMSQLRAVVWLDRSYKNGNSGAKLAKLAQLMRIARLPSKAVFAARVIVEAISVLWLLNRQEQEIKRYQMLLYRLKSGSR